MAITALMGLTGMVHGAPGKSDAAPDATAKQAQAAKREEQKSREMADDKGRGEQTSQEMQERREERKQIQEAYRETAGDGPKAKKKPWWKFWGSDDDA